MLPRILPPPHSSRNQYLKCTYRTEEASRGGKSEEKQIYPKWMFILPDRNTPLENNGQYTVYGQDVSITQKFRFFPSSSLFDFKNAGAFLLIFLIKMPFLKQFF